MSKSFGIGAKFQTFENDVRKVVRLTKYKNDNTVVVLDENGVKTILPIGVLKEKYVELSPDAFLNLMITSNDNYDGQDVYACVNKALDLALGKQEPSLILRQDIYSYAKNPLSMGNVVWVGDCLTDNTMPGDGKLVDMMEFTNIDKKDYFYLYSNDTIDDIFTIIGKDAKKYDTVLAELVERNSDTIKGYCSTLRQLFEENGFINAYRSIFGIAQVDWPVVLGDESYNENGDIILNAKQIKAISDILRKYITNVKVIEYDYDIDVSEIVAFKHIMISDEKQKIYLIAYEEAGNYPVDNDIARGMGLV